MNYFKIATCGLIIASLFLKNVSPVNSNSANDSIQWKLLGKEAADLEGHWAERVFQWAIHNQMIEGYPDGSFQPDTPIKEAEFLKIFYRAFGAALPTIQGQDWTEGPYRLAEMWNQPVRGFNDPINRTQAAELIASAQGVNYIGDDAIIYLLGHSLSTGKTAPTLEGFAGSDLLTRAEAVQWIRTLKLRGMVSIKKRPVEPSDRSLLPELPSGPPKVLVDFVLNPVVMEDFSFIDIKKSEKYLLGSTRNMIEERFGPPKNQFHMNIYNQGLSIHYTPEGLMDAWAWNMELGDSTSFQTNNGLQLGECTLFEVLEAYGTAGYDGNGSATYIHEMVDGELIPRSSRFEVENPDNAFVISMNFDKETLKVRFFYVARYRNAFPDK